MPSNAELAQASDWATEAAQKLAGRVDYRLVPSHLVYESLSARQSQIERVAAALRSERARAKGHGGVR